MGNLHIDRIELRSAVLSDAEMVFEWRNNFETRRYFFDSRPLEMDEHMRWFEETLQMSNRYLLIAQVDSEAMGVLRYDVSGITAEIDIYISPERKGSGYGAKILEAGMHWVQLNLPMVKILHAKILPENIASLRTFEKAGFQLKTHIYEFEVK